MFFVLTMVIAAAICILQLLLCFRGRKKWLKCLPGGLLIVFELVCWGMYWLARTEILVEIHSIEMGFAGVVFGMMGLYWAGGIVLAWLIYGVGKLLKRTFRRNIIWRI